MKPYLIVFLCSKNAKLTEYWYTSQRSNLMSLLEEVDDKVPDDEQLLAVWRKDWRDDSDWEILAEFGHSAKKQPENAEYFLNDILKKQKREKKPSVPLPPAYVPPFKIVTASYPLEKAA